MKITLFALAAVAVVGTVVPAQAEVAVPGSVTATDRSLRAACHYQKLAHINEWSETSEITGFAVSYPDADVRLRCTVTPLSGIVTEATAEGFNVATISTIDEVWGRGPVKICVEAWSNHTVDIQEYVYACRTYEQNG